MFVKYCSWKAWPKIVNTIAALTVMLFGHNTLFMLYHWHQYAKYILFFFHHRVRTNEKYKFNFKFAIINNGWWPKMLVFRIRVSQLVGIEFQSNDFIYSYGIKSISKMLIKPINGYQYLNIIIQYTITEKPRAVVRFTVNIQRQVAISQSVSFTRVYTPFTQNTKKFQP